MLIRSDARHIPLADESVHCVVTSPPYWGLRAYQGNPGMIGLEPTFEEHLENLVAVFREVRRVLRQDGTLWLNYGDAYSRGDRWDSGGHSGLGGREGRIEKPLDLPRKTNLKAKDLMMMPARVAMALQADGWWLRSEIIWHKPNPMPESCRDRPTSAHEKVFLLSKSAKYFYDAEAVRVPSQEPSRATFRGGVDGYTGQDGDGVGGGHVEKDAGQARAMTGANLRNVWKIPTQAVSEAHFATFPEKLVSPCIEAGTSEKGCCSECGAPWVREVDKEVVKNRPSAGKDPRARGEDKLNAESKHGHKGNNLQTKFSTTGWSPTCDHNSEPIPCIILDPFAGSGTVVRVATRLNRRGIGCDLDYHDIAKKRTANLQRQLIS